MIIRQESLDDIGPIHRVVEAAFGQDAEAELVDSLRDNGDIVISLVAEDRGEIVGHVLISRLRAPADCAALAPVSVAPERQKQGIGSKLIREGLEHARSDGWKAVFLLGEPEYYDRFGFRVSAAAKFETEYPKAYFMALELSPGALEHTEGAVIYASPFSALG